MFIRTFLFFLFIQKRARNENILMTYSVYKMCTTTGIYLSCEQFNAPKNLSRTTEYILKEGWSLPIARRDSQGRQKNGREGVRKEGREKCHAFLGTNLRGETAATPFLSLPSPFQHPPPRGPVYCFTYSPTATGQQRYFVYKFWLLWGVVHHRSFSADAVQPLPDSPVSLYCGFSVTQGGLLPVDSGQRGVELSSDMSRAPSGVGKQDVEWVIEEGADQT